MKRMTAEWVRKAEVDLRAARSLAANDPPAHDVVCFCCQQATEKYLKALLEEQGQAVPRTHDLEDLRARVKPHYPSLRAPRRVLKRLTQFAVDTRYPGKHANKRQALAALRWAERVRDEARSLLKIRPRKARKKS
jgi:HEPN domain-containing protein